ncbi:MAG: hypothetical protein ACE5RI_05340 [Candidatus Nitrosomaritimum yanchengensis]
MTNYSDNEKPAKKSIERISNLSNSPKIGLMVQVLDIIVKVGSAI